MVSPPRSIPSCLSFGDDGIVRLPNFHSSEELHLRRKRPQSSTGL